MEEQPTSSPEQGARHPLRRPGCLIGLILWFVILLSPCFMITLAIRGEISLTTGSAPEQRIRVWLIQEARQSGIGLSSAQVQTVGEEICVQTDVHFLLWRGQADSTQYCTCYLQSGDDWQTSSLQQNACPSDP